MKALTEGVGNCVICTKQGQLVTLEMEEALAMKKEFDMDGYQILTALTNNFGGFR